MNKYIKEIQETGTPKASYEQIEAYCNKLIKELDLLNQYGYTASTNKLIPFMSAMDLRMAEADVGSKYTSKMGYVNNTMAWKFEQKITKLIETLTLKQ